jgi:hypothetical protein
MNRRSFLVTLAAGASMAPRYHGFTYYWGSSPAVWQRWNGWRQQWLVSPESGPVQWVKQTDPIKIGGPRVSKAAALRRLEQRWAGNRGGLSHEYVG